MKFLPEDRDFGFMRWRLLSRELDDDGNVKCEIHVLPLVGVGTYLRTILHTPEGVRYEDPVLLKNALVLEIVRRESTSALVDAAGAAPEEAMRCIGREIVSIDVAKKRFQPKGHKGPYADLEIVPGSLLTQEQRQMVQPPMSAERLPPEVLKKMQEEIAGKAE